MNTRGHRPALLGELWHLLIRTGTLGISARHQACTAGLCNAEAQMVLTSAQYASCSSSAVTAESLVAPQAAGCQQPPGFRRQPALLLAGLRAQAPVLSCSCFGTAAAAAMKEPAHQAMGQWPEQAPSSLPTHQSELPSSV